jgi:hypothetical protein
MSRRLQKQNGNSCCRLLIGTLLIVAFGASCGERGVGATREKCEQRGADKFCYKATYTGDDAGRIDVTWTYAEDKFVGEVSIHEVFWSAIINCKTNSGNLQDVELRNAYGTEVFIDQDLLTSMWQGIQNEQVDIMTTQTCEDL